MSDGQRLAVDQLRDIEDHAGGALIVHSVGDEERGPLWLDIVISVDCSGLETRREGLPIRQRERLIVYVHRDFPFKVPQVYTPHDRFAGFPHVQWRRHLCLYVAPDTEWDVNDGLFGFMTRLHEWLRRGALGELDPPGEPLHPPVAYTSSSAEKVVGYEPQILDIGPMWD
jgi:hypothetical protein